ncbi:MAG: diguanylate cyclase [Candidatus Omnitrophota bacterium]
MLAYDVQPVTIKILLVDDDPDFVRFLQLASKLDDPISYEMTHVHSLEEAHRALQEGAFDAVLLDLGLPDSQGIGTFEWLAAAHPDIPCVILSGNDDEHVALEAVRQGAQDYVVKGEIVGKTIFRTVAHAVERNRQKKQMEEANMHLEKLSILDPLTRLLNRRGLQRMLSREIRLSGREGTNLSVILIDLDDFKSINDAHGHAAGDAVLQRVAKIMRGTVRESDYVARVGGDEFILLLPNTRLAEGLHFSERVRRAIAQATIPISNDISVRVTASFASVSADRKIATVDRLLEETHEALARSKRLGKNRVSTGGPGEMPPDHVVEMLWEGNCLRAVKQPICELATGRVDGYEFLSRSSILGFEMPNDFFHLSKENNILSRVDERCLEKSVAAASRVSQEAYKHINLFPSTLSKFSPEKFARFFPTTSPGRSWCVEISEQQILGDPSLLVPAVENLKAQKILLAIDGVGFGRSSLESLIVLQPDVIKIDKKFVQNISQDPDRREMLARLLSVLRSFHAKIIAEGIESPEDLKILRSIGVPYGQGFLWGEPG